jgi:hypothetical protein
MSETSLRRLLNLFEESQGVLSIPYLAGRLDVTPERVASLIDFWIRKGKLQISDSGSDCGHCSFEGDCHLVPTFPRFYELVGSEREDPVFLSSHSTR